MQDDLFFQHNRKPPVIHEPRIFAHLSREDAIAACEPRQYTISMYGKRMKRPRLEAWFHDDPKRTYRFGGGEPIAPRAFPPYLDEMRRLVQERAGERFDSCFVNVYRDGRDSIDWHADDDAWIGPTIASVTLGRSRKFEMKPKDHGPERAVFELGHGDLLVMLPGCQKEWVHRVPKTSRGAAAGIRFNATFRQTVRDAR